VTARVYIRPVGVFRASVKMPVQSDALHIAGRRDLLFGAAEVIERTDGAVRRRLVPATELLDAGNPALAEVRRFLQQSRPAIAGLPVDRPRIMGVVNVTPDSFSDGGQHLEPEAAIAHGLRLEAEGADILDIGGESTRPGAEPVSIEEECRRVLPVIEGLARRTRLPLSIDTRNAEVMRRAAQSGASLINDVSALTHDPGAVEVAAATGFPVILMHAQGDPRTMQRNPTYRDVVLDVYDVLQERIAACEAAGIPRERLIVDPGIGFGKTLAHNLALLGSLTIFHGLGSAVALGASRKSFVGKLTGASAADRLPGSLAAALLGAAQGVQILRVHDVAATRQALAVWEGASGPAS
jgi:dihydropteroate synthase